MKDSPNPYSHLQNILVEIAELLQPARGEQNLLGLEEIEPEILGVADNNPRPSNSRARMTVLSQDDLDWIHSLQNRIMDLEGQLQRKQGKDMATQTSSEHAPIPEQHELSQNPFSNPSSSAWHPYRNPQPNFIDSEFCNPNQRPFSLINNPDISDDFPESNHFPFPNSDPLSRLSYRAPLDFRQINPTLRPLPDKYFPQPNPSPNPIPSHPNSFRHNPNPYPPFQYPGSYQTRHTLPVSKWNITKYSGDDQGLKLNEFLEHVQALSQAEHVTERELFESAVHLFTGSALNWYMSQRSTGRLMNWQHLVFELRRTYMHPDLDALIKMKIYQRRQQKYESFHEFYFEMERMFRTMSFQIPDFEKMQILQQNMRVDYRRQMTFLPIADLETLVAAGQKLDALNFSAYNKVFGAEKTVQVVTNQESESKKKQKGSQVQSQSSNQTALVNSSSQPRDFRGPSTSQNTVSNPNSSNRYEQQNSQTRNLSKEPSTNPPIAGPSGTQSRPPLTLEEVVNNHKPPSNGTCLNCGRFGHHFAMCRQPRGIFCSTCGLRGFPSDLCPYCIKNGTTANENRRPQTPQA